jgi:hypothetical protein
MKKILSFFILSFLFFFLVGPLASAQLLNSDVAGELNKKAETTTGQAGLTNISLGVLAANIIQVLLSLLGVIFLVLIIIAGFKWMTAAGNEEQIKKAQASMKSAIIGLVLILAAYAITYFVFNYLPFAGGSSRRAV